MRLLLDGIIGDLEPLEEVARDAVDDDGPTNACAHPPERQVDASVLGGAAMVLCLVCGQQRPGVAPQ